MVSRWRVRSGGRLKVLLQSATGHLGRSVKLPCYSISRGVKKNTHPTSEAPPLLPDMASGTLDAGFNWFSMEETAPSKGEAEGVCISEGDQSGLRDAFFGRR